MLSQDIIIKYSSSFWAKVHVLGEDDCWPWLAGDNGKGYGRIRCGEVKLAAHIFSYRLHNSDYEDGCHICHKCDNRACVNPKHLFKGNSYINMQDKHRKGRGGYNKLKPEDIPTIRKLWSEGLNGPQIGRIYSITKGQVYNVVKGKSWNFLNE